MSEKQDPTTMPIMTELHFAYYTVALKGQLFTHLCNIAFTIASTIGLSVLPAFAQEGNRLNLDGRDSTSISRDSTAGSIYVDSFVKQHTGFRLFQSDIKNFPVRGVKDLLLLNSSIIEQDGELHFRGGLPDEIGYFVEGVSTRNVLTGQNLATIIPEALERLEVNTGTAGVEWGLANSGFVNHMLRSGTNDFRASLQTETDNFTAQNEKRFGTYSYGYSDYVITVSGPIIEDRIRFFLAGENRFDRDWAVQFLQGFRFENLPDQSSPSLPPRDTVEAFELKSGNFPGQLRNRYTANGTLDFDFQPLKVRLLGAFTTQREQGTVTPVQSVFNLARQPIREMSDLLISAQAEYLFGPTMSVRATLSFGDDRTKTFDPDLGDNFVSYDDSVAAGKAGYQFFSATRPPILYVLYGWSIDRYGNPKTRFEKNRQEMFGGSFSVSKQITERNTITLGGSLQRYSLRHYDVGTGWTAFVRANPEFIRTAPQAEIDFAFSRIMRPLAYGYDIYGSVVERGTYGPKRPQFFGLYLYDKHTFDWGELTGGLRFDMLDYGDSLLIDPTNPLAGTVPREIFKEVSYRVGFSYNFSDKVASALHVGRYVQVPKLNEARDPIVATHIELRVHGQPWDWLSVDAAGFYRKNPDEDTQRGDSVLIDTRGVRTKGVELNAALGGIERLRANLSYTFSDTRGTGFDYLLGFNHTHRGVLNIDYRFGDDDGGSVLENSGIDLLFSFASGHPFYRPSGAEEGGLISADSVLSSTADLRTTPWTSSVALKIEKSLFIGSVSLNFYIYIQNLLNTKNVLNVYRRTGNADDDGYLSDPNLSGDIIQALGPRYVELYKAINLANGEHYRRVTGNGLWGTPRQIRFGLKVDI